MNMVLVKDISVDTAEELLRKENVRLRMENAILREKLRREDIGITAEKMEMQYRNYYRDKCGELV